MRKGAWIVAFLLIMLPVAAHADMDNYPVARLRMLDKVTARTSTFNVRIGTTVKFGPLYIKPRTCRKAPPIETPESAAFLQIWEVEPKVGPQWIFSGWMFASSPALSSMDNPIYDVWLLDCLSDTPAAPAPATVSVPTPGASQPGAAMHATAKAGTVMYGPSAPAVSPVPPPVPAKSPESGDTGPDQTQEDQGPPVEDTGHAAPNGNDVAHPDSSEPAPEMNGTGGIY